MTKFNFKVPSSKEEMDELRKALSREISEDDLDAVSGGNETQPPTPWICTFCGITLMVKRTTDIQKHLIKCPENPYRYND